VEEEQPLRADRGQVGLDGGVGERQRQEEPDVEDGGDQSERRRAPPRRGEAGGRRLGAARIGEAAIDQPADGDRRQSGAQPAQQVDGRVPSGAGRRRR
jgi:hypothetical protein